MYSITWAGALVFSNQIFPFVSIASLRGCPALKLVAPMLETLTCGVPFGLNSVRLEAVVLLWFITQMLPDASAAMFCGSFSGVAPVY